MPIYSYYCPGGHEVEARRGYEVATISCPQCGGTAQRTAVYRFSVSGVPQPKYRLSEFQEAAQEANYYHERMENDRGKPLPRRLVIQGAIEDARKRGARVKPFAAKGS